MKTKDFILKVGLELSPRFREFGYQYFKSSGCFEQRGLEFSRCVVIDAVKWKSSENILLNFPLHLRFHKIEEILNDFRPNIGKEQSATTATITRFFGDMIPPEVQDGMILKSDRQISAVCSAGLDAFIRFGAPFFDKFSTIEKVQEAFLSPSTNWPVQNRLRRYEFLLASFFLIRNKAAFDSMIVEVSEFGAKYNSGFHKPYLQGLMDGLSLKLK